ncbi:hypothetical protein WMF11_37785 [Sorangium sp. So ce295]|jgi:hypothetical protein|uniref:hypothetical protein n=1 Tax=Sorangium sp. So ce295 TaxID=3133295 RepID=UPI003F6145E0
MKSATCLNLAFVIGLTLASRSASAAGIAADAPVGVVAVQMRTGGDDKRDDSRVWIRVNLKNGNSSTEEASGDPTWKDWSWGAFTYIQLPGSTKSNDIASVTVFWRHGGNGFNGDNWNLQQLNVWAFDNANNEWVVMGKPSGNPLQRFTGNDEEYTWEWHP